MGVCRSCTCGAFRVIHVKRDAAWNAEFAIGPSGLQRLFGQLLCLSHGTTCIEQSGTENTLRNDLILTPFDEDADENGNRDDLVATGTVEPSPEWLQCRGSRWVLRIDDNGVKSESELEQN
jgi:hypothetical protein